jgi:hypothetical protein
VLALATLQAAVFDVPHFLWIAAIQHLGHQVIVVCCLVARMGALKRLPVVGKDLLEDIPVPRGCCNHQGTPSWGGRMFAVKRLYHGSPASSTPHRLLSGYPYPPLLFLRDGDFRDRENAFSYTIKKVMHRAWGYFQARLAFTMAAFNVLVQWHVLRPNASGFVPLSIAEFSL